MVIFIDESLPELRELNLIIQSINGVNSLKSRSYTQI
jgi:hypothetical protein